MTQAMAEPIDRGREEWTGRSPSRDRMELLHRSETDSSRRVAIRHGLWAAVIVYLLFSVTDLLLIPDAAALAIAARFTIGIGTLIVVEWQFRHGASASQMDLVCAVALMLAYAGWLFSAITTEYRETISYYLVFGAIFMMSPNLFFTFRFRYSLLVSGAMLIASLSVLFHLFPNNHVYQISFGIFHVSSFIFTSYVNWRLNRERHAVFSNALEAKIQHAEATALLRLSRTDPLTGLENRRAIDDRLHDLWTRWQQNGEKFGALLIDVDFFKRFNDYYGHQDGDQCLITVADALREAMRPGVSIGRYGGEEFIVLAAMEDDHSVLGLAEELRSAVEARAIIHQQRRDGIRTVTVSIGAAVTRQQSGAKLDKIILEADRALYLAKASGRNCVKLFDPEDPQSSNESENIAALLSVGVQKQYVSLVYQPIRNVNTHRLEALEALMRLKTPDGTYVPPSLFIPVAERTGAIQELGRWAIRTACHDVLAPGLAPMASINVSPVQLKAPGFAASVAAILGETGVSGNRLAFEITEGLEMEMHSDVLRCISDLKLLGIRIWLDDFGTGFAGLSWLRLIEFDAVKVDRSFLYDCMTQRGVDMFKDIITLVRNRGPKILVEGVESAEQMSLLQRLGIDLIQGFHIGRPARVESFMSARLPASRQSA